MSPGKLKRREALMKDLLDYALRSNCRWVMCNGPVAPIRTHLTCLRCASINRAIRMGLVRIVKEQYISKNGYVVSPGVLELVEEVA